LTETTGEEYIHEGVPAVKAQEATCPYAYPTIEHKNDDDKVQDNDSVDKKGSEDHDQEL
jgi:hypothetical protein